MGENSKIKIIVYLVILLMVGALVGAVMASYAFEKGKEQVEKRWGGPKPWDPPRDSRGFNFNFWGSIIFISINLFLLIGLLGIYVSTYWKTQSSFMLGLILFISVLAIQSFLSLPLLHTLFGFTAFGLGFFGVLPHMFETVALVILFILSAE